jgi:dCTP deaminase
MSAGILCEKQVRKLIHPSGGTTRLYRPSGKAFDKLLGPSAIDLPLGSRYWEMEGSCRTGKEYKVQDLIRKHSLVAKTLQEAPVKLERCRVYLFEADCALDLTDTPIEGKATAKSSVGRLDVLVRLLVDGSEKFDFLEKGRKHVLYIEVTPISFDLEVRQGTALSQLRLYKGKDRHISLTNEELSHEEVKNFPVVNEKGEPYTDPCKLALDDPWFPFRLDLTPDPIAKCSGFVAKEREELKKLPPINPDKSSCYNPKLFWEKVKAKDGAILLEPGRLYILRSKERLRIPKHLALECKSYTTEMGEWRIEYAGFAHPYFGCSRKNGSPIIFEVRGHNVPTILTEEIPLGNVRFLRMSQPAAKPDNPAYEKQELKLSKCFKAWA